MKFISGIVLNCEETFLNCETCYFKLNINFDCLKCNEKSSFIENKNECVLFRKVDLMDSIITYLEDEIYDIECKENFIFNESLKKCELINSNCGYGCKKCIGINRDCIECTEGFELIGLICIFKIEKTIITEESENFIDIIQFFYYKDSCDKITNNVTVKVENNITTYLNKEIYVNDKKYEILEFYVDCSKEKEKCEEYNKIKFNVLKKLGLSNCEKIYNHNYEVLIKNFTNITINEFDDKCVENKNRIYLKEEIRCENEDCLNFSKIKEYENYTDIKKCQNEIKEENFEVIKKDIENITIDKCEYCQKSLNFLCPWEENCKKECEFTIGNDNNHIFIEEKNKKITKINFSVKLLKKEVPNSVNINFDYEKQKIRFEFLKNIKSINFEIKPSQIINIKNCRISKNQKFLIKNLNYRKNLKFAEKILTTESAGNTTARVTSSVLSFFIIPNFIYKFLQFNELFTYFAYLDIDGGSFYNFILSIQRKDNDIDKYFFLNEKKEYEYKMILPKLKNLITISLLDYYLIFSIIFIYIGKIFLKNTIYYRF